MVKQLKLTVSSRISPPLKKVLEQRADEAGMTTSMYIEQFLRQGLSSDGALNEEDFMEEEYELVEPLEEIQEEYEEDTSNGLVKNEVGRNEVDTDKKLASISDEFDKRLSKLENQIAIEPNQIEDLEKENSLLQEKISELEAEYETAKSVIEQADSTSGLGAFEFEEGELEELENYLNKISAKYPNLSRNQVLINALKATVQNEESLAMVITNISDIA